MSGCFHPRGLHAAQDSLSLTISQTLPRFMSIESVMPFNHLILCWRLLLLLPIFPTIRVFSNESAVYIRWPKCWSFSFSPSNEYSGLISFKIDWFDLLAAQGTLKNLLQHQSKKASILWCSAFFMVQLLHDYWKSHIFDFIDFLDKVMSLLFNMLSRFCQENEFFIANTLLQQ